MKLLPELSAILPGVAPSAPLEPEMEKRRLHAAIAGLLTRLALHTPLMITMKTSTG